MDSDVARLKLCCRWIPLVYAATSLGAQVGVEDMSQADNASGDSA